MVVVIVGSFALAAFLGRLLIPPVRLGRRGDGFNQYLCQERMPEPLVR